ncbi:MAG: sialidase family protein, partial [bacterium]
MISGFVQIDILHGPEPPSVVAYHHKLAGVYSAWIDIDQGNGYGILPNNPKTPGVNLHLWPYIAAAPNNTNIVMVTGDYDYDLHHMYLTTNLGDTWTQLAEFDSCFALSQFVRVSRNPGSQKIVHAWTQSIAVEYAGYLISQMANDVFYQVSIDNGVTWGTPVNIIHYTPPGQMVNGDTTPWAFSDVNAVFDNNDNLHIVWASHMGWMHNDTIYFNDRAKIFHWDEVSNTITKVNSPSIYYNEPNGWWLKSSSTLGCGSWRLIADRPQLIVETINNLLYCLWLGNDDYNDTSAAGWPNSEIYASYSTDNGATWANYVNLTNTRTPGAPAGECLDEDYMSANPFVVNDSIYITYIEDKDAGNALDNEGTFTENPVRCWVFPTNLIIHGIEETAAHSASSGTPGIEVYPNPFKNAVSIKFQIPIRHDAWRTKSQIPN